jgi:PAS domain S-box-containing protein
MPNTSHNAPKSEAPDALHRVGTDERIASSIPDTHTAGNSAAVSGITPDQADITNGRTNTIAKNDGALNGATASDVSKPPFYWFTTHLNLPYLVLAALLVATGVAAWRTYKQEKQLANVEFTRVASATAGRIKSAIDDVERVMRGASGLIAANPELTDKQWLIYLNSLDQTLRVPGLNEIGFWRADVSNGNIKVANYKLLPNLSYAVVPNSAIVPPSDAWKLDTRIVAAISEAQRLQAFTISAPLDWTPRVPQSAMAVLMVMPVYTNPRDSTFSQQEKSAPIGFIHALVRIDELFTHAIPEGSTQLNITLADGESTVFSTNQMPGAVSAGQTQAHRFNTSLSQYGRPWQLSITGQVRELDAEVNRLPILIGMSGIIGTVLIAGLIFLLSRLRKQAQGLAATMTVQLRNQVKLTEDLIEMNPVPIYRKDAQGRYISFNRAWENMTGFDRTSYIGRTVNDVQAEEQAFATERVEMELLQNPGLVITEEQRFLINNGTTLDVIVSKTAIFDTDGKPAGMVGTVTDVSQIKKLESELREQNKFTADLIEFNPTPIFRKDAAGRWVAVNAAWERFTGRHRSEALGKTNREYQRPEVADQNDAADRQLLQSPSGYTTGNIRLKNVQGEIFETIVARALIRRTDGTIDGMIGTITDITPMFKLEQMLSAQREQLDLVIRSSQQGIWDIRYVPNTSSQPAPYFSDRFYNILGYSSTDTATAPISFEQIIHPDDFAQFEVARLAHFAGKTRFFDAECRAQTKSGQFVWLRTRGIAQSEASHDNKKDKVAADTHTVRFTGSIIDITTNKNAEVELFEANIRVTESAKAKESFLATMSHEIRTPLNGVLGMANLLSETPLTDEQQDYIRVIRASGDTLLGLIDDILDFTKIESGRMALENQPLDLIGVIESAMEMVQEKAREKKLYLLFSIADEVPNYVMGDITRLRQVLTNLLSNAVKFTPAGQISISVEINAVASPRFELIIRVADTGIGIPENRINKLFQPFTQVDETTTRRFGGTGLGLVISKRICELMGGSVSATSVEGQGSVFTVKIITQSARGPLQPHMLRNISEFEDKSVLLIGGYLPYQTSLALLLQRWGLRTTVALNEAAMAHLNPRQHFDVVLAELDLERPFNAPLCIALDNAREDSEIKHGHTLPVILHSKHKRSEIAKQEPSYILTHDFLIARSLSRGKLCDTLQRALSGVGHADVSLRPYAHDPVYEDAFTSLADRATPQAEPTSPAVALAAEKRLAKQTANRANLSPLRILIAEDNEINRRVILGMLKNLGYEAVVAENGRLAVNAALAETFDLVLMDIHMPELDGLGAMEQIRAHCRDAQCPRIVAMTAHALSGDREHYLESGMDDYIAKPIKMNDLTQALERTCQALNPGNYNATAAAAPPSPTVPIEAFAPEVHHVKTPAPKKVTTERDFSILDAEQLEDLRYLPAAPDEIVDPNNPMAGLISLFLVKARERLLSVQTALAAHKWHDVAELAHSLRGSTASMGFLRVAFICKELELSARAREEVEKIDPAAALDFTKFADLLSRLRLNFAEAETALYDWQKQIQAEG